MPALSFHLPRHLHPSSFSSKHTFFELWHHCLGHPFLSQIQFLIKLVHDVTPSTIPCSICPLAKQTKNYNLLLVLISLLFLLIWFIVVFGDHSTPILEGHKYFFLSLLIITYQLLGFILKCKSQVSILFPIFFKLVKIQFNTKIKKLCINHGTKFFLTYFLNSKGIIHQYSCVETPQKNSIVERKHQHLLNIAHAIMFHLQLLIFLGWCYFNNHSPYQ